MDIYPHWPRDHFQAKEVKISLISTEKIIANGMTKSLRYQRCIEIAGILNLPPNIIKQDLIVDIES